MKKKIVIDYTLQNLLLFGETGTLKEAHAFLFYDESIFLLHDLRIKMYLKILKILYSHLHT